MAAAIASILAKVLIQVGADEPKEIGTIEIPINFSVNEIPVPALNYPINQRKSIV